MSCQVNKLADTALVYRLRLHRLSSDLAWVSSNLAEVGRAYRDLNRHVHVKEPLTLALPSLPSVFLADLRLKTKVLISPFR